jgi:hypothetical protein
MGWTADLAINAVLMALSPTGSSQALTSANSPVGAVSAGNSKQRTVNSLLAASLTLALLVLGVLANDANDALAVDYLALVADRFY